MLIYTLCFGCFYYAGINNSLILVIGGMSLFGISGGAVFMLVNIFINRYTSEEYMSSIYSLISSICTVSNVVFQFIFGIIIDGYGIRSLTIIATITSVILACGFMKLKEVESEQT